MKKAIVLLLAAMLLIGMTGLGSAWTWGPKTTTSEQSATDSGTTPSGATWSKYTSEKSSSTVSGAGSGDTVPSWFLKWAGGS